MKKAIWLTMVAFILLVPLAAASITVTSPQLNVPWCKGTSYTITWTSPGVTGPVTILLRKANAPNDPAVLNIAPNTANDGSFENWVVPNSVPDGTYVIRVRTLTNPTVIHGDSPQFQIKSCGGTSPSHGSGLKTTDFNFSGQPDLTAPIPRKPDLIVCKILPEILDIHLGSHMLKYRVHNIGKGDAEACTLWIDLCGVKGFAAVKALKAGEYEEFAYEAVLPTIMPTNPYTFHVDKPGKVMESDENNNILTGVLSISVSEPAKCSDGQRHSIFKVTKK